MSHSLNSLSSFAGRLHPLLVHLPIGAMVLLGFLEFVSQATRWKNAAQNSRWILGFACLSAGAAAVSGWALGQSGGYDVRSLRVHQASGFVFLGVCGLTVLLRHFNLSRAYRFSLLAALAALVIAGHLGGSITHGRDFLTLSAPSRSPAFAGQPVDPTGRKRSVGPQLDQPVFTAVVAPILQRRCVTCHGADKQKADLRLDTLGALLKGGQNGPVIKPGAAEASGLVQRVLLPLDHDGHMPPEGLSQITEQEIAVLQWWVNAGAPGEQKVGNLKPEADIRRLLELVSRRPESAD